MIVSHVSLPMVGEIENGDGVLVRTDEQGRALIAVVDGLGHGPQAALVSRRALECLNGVSLGDPVLSVMQLLHRELAGSRGAAATLCTIREGAVEACAVGNVEIRSAELRLPLVFSAGILGSRVAKFHVARANLVPRARLVLFSDGISSRTPLDRVRHLSPEAACAAIIAQHRRKEDDATILVADLE
ncbi:MAG TPA: SpoIIE family protein phosphatase [Polyangiaceae bacterium]|nr:SpoIIE family protein phosphatase [Polyangiaceae bacterium]